MENPLKDEVNSISQQGARSTIRFCANLAWNFALIGVGISTFAIGFGGYILYKEAKKQQLREKAIEFIKKGKSGESELMEFMRNDVTTKKIIDQVSSLTKEVLNKIVLENQTPEALINAAFKIYTKIFNFPPFKEIILGKFITIRIYSIEFANQVKEAQPTFNEPMTTNKKPELIKFINSIKEIEIQAFNLPENANQNGLMDLKAFHQICLDTIADGLKEMIDRMPAGTLETASSHQVGSNFSQQQIN